MRYFGGCTPVTLNVIFALTPAAGRRHSGQTSSENFSGAKKNIFNYHKDKLILKIVIFSKITLSLCIVYFTP